MKRIINSLKLVVWVLVIFIFLAYPFLLTAGERTIVNGVVSTTKNSSGNIIAVKLNLVIEGGEIFNIALNETGKKLGIEMDGKWVEVIGEVYDRGGDMWIEVRSYKRFVENIFE